MTHAGVTPPGVLHHHRAGSDRGPAGRHGGSAHFGHREAPPPPKHDPAAALVRNLVVDRVLEMNVKQGLHAWEYRRRTAIGPHGLAFLYVELHATGDQTRLPQLSVQAATRLFLDGEDVRELPQLLYRMAGIAERRLARGIDFDPLECMVDRRDEVAEPARYAGVAVSSLDAPGFDWSDLPQSSVGPLGLTGRCLAILNDQTRLFIDRGTSFGGAQTTIRSSQQMDVTPGHTARPWSWLTDPIIAENSAEYWLHRLHAAVLEGYRRRDQRAATR